MFLDRDDPFPNVLMQQWNNREIPNKYPWWKLVRTIAPVEMEQTRRFRQPICWPGRTTG